MRSLSADVIESEAGWLSTRAFSTSKYDRIVHCGPLAYLYRILARQVFWPSLHYRSRSRRAVVDDVDLSLSEISLDEVTSGKERRPSSRALDRGRSVEDDGQFPSVLEDEEQSISADGEPHPVTRRLVRKKNKESGITSPENLLLSDLLGEHRKWRDLEPLIAGADHLTRGDEMRQGDKDNEKKGKLKKDMEEPAEEAMELEVVEGLEREEDADSEVESDHDEDEDERDLEVDDEELSALDSELSAEEEALPDPRPAALKGLSHERRLALGAVSQLLDSAHLGHLMPSEEMARLVLSAEALSFSQRFLENLLSQRLFQLKKLYVTQASAKSLPFPGNYNSSNARMAIII